jgi:hypothetical protein
VAEVIAKWPFFTPNPRPEHTLEHELGVRRNAHIDRFCFCERCSLAPDDPGKRDFVNAFRS